MTSSNLEINQIHNMDCLEGLMQLPDNSIDLVITSPPYNLSFRYGGGKKTKLYSNYDDNLSEDDYYEFIKQCIKQLIRDSRFTFFNFQLLTNNKKPYLKIIGDFSENIKDIIIWNKKQCQPSIAKTCLSSKFEFIIIFAKKDLCEKRSFERAFFNNRISGQETYNVIEGNSASVKEFNSAQGSNKAVFPQYLVRYILKKFSKEKDIILDPFMGSGTTALVCKQLNRNYIGFEIDEEYCKIALERLSQERLSQNTLFSHIDKQDGGNGIPPTNKLVGILPEVL